ncbi:Histone H2B [Spironucleus salmonicida]|uniref:Histone H2B n=1 Tax=Spironucleus salmonicida TaxID=348837 RepID=V6M0M9_9EUKA|nr:Histone H2B [Spironucleus salmonicida]KAH0571241.1 Histone H2B [Spironucleus salmonicida]KAH0571243.1 Histone H2B [Spironucleus salmonicida]KAH0571245.1 Histone H2B [Spironucleus salmonicida]KAH0571247.1 Histone H2B [Spironucleus salmonicida]|eukprot:EST46669.1 Histone H2B [Spironucleus salmonicida]
MSLGSAPEAKATRKMKRVETYGTYILKVLKASDAFQGKDADCGVSKQCMAAMNSMVNDLFERIASEASQIARQHHRNTIGKSQITAAAKLVLNGGELYKAAQSHAESAISKYSSNK